MENNEVIEVVEVDGHKYERVACLEGDSCRLCCFANNLPDSCDPLPPCSENYKPFVDSYYRRVS